MRAQALLRFQLLIGVLDAGFRAAVLMVAAVVVEGVVVVVGVVTTLQMPHVFLQNSSKKFLY